MSNQDTRTAPAFEGADLHRLTGSSTPGAPDAATVCLGPDAALIRQAEVVKDLGIRDETLFSNDPGVGSDEYPAWRDEVDRNSDLLREAAEELASMPATTASGVAAKASALSELKSWHESALSKHETLLIKSLIEDVSRTAASGSIGTSDAATAVGLAREFKFAQQPNVLERTPEQKLLLLNRQYERVLAFDNASWRAADAAPYNTEDKERLELANKHAQRMRREIEAEAYAIPAASVRSVALKARIMSGDLHIWWDPSCEDHDTLGRFIIEDVLALAGLDRIRTSDADFVDLMPEYKGLGRVIDEPAAVPQAKAPPASSIHALGVELQALWDCYSRIDEQNASSSTAHRMNRISERTNVIEKQVSFMEPVTLADIMLQMAVVSDLVSDMAEETVDTFDHRAATNRIDRVLCATLRCLSRLTGLSLRDVGAEPYLGNAYELFQQDLTQLDQQQAAA